MSILNYFGKVNSQYKKYNCQIPEYTSYVFNCDDKYENLRDENVRINGEQFRWYYSNNTSRQKKLFSFRNEKKKDPYNRYENTKRIIGWVLGNDGGTKEFTFNNTDYPISNPLNLIVDGFRVDGFQMGECDSIEIRDTYCSYLSPELYIFSFTNLFDTFSKCIEKVREKLYSKIWNTIECCPLINIIDLLILKQSDTDKHIKHIKQMFQSLIDDNKLLQNKINLLEKQLLNQ